MRTVCYCFVMLLVAVAGGRVNGQATPPKIFLDKSPRIVAYQLKRLDNSRLLMVERTIDDVKYAPVYKAILTRAGMSPDEQWKAAHALAKINKSSVAKETLAAIGILQADSRQDRFTAGQLTSLLLNALDHDSDVLVSATASNNELLRRAGFAGLFSLGETDKAISLANTSESTKSWLNAVTLLPSQQSRNQLRQPIVDLLVDSDNTVRLQAITALASIDDRQDSTYQAIAPLLNDEFVRGAVVQTLLSIPATSRDRETSSVAVDRLVKFAESTPTADRTSVEFSNAMQLADKLLADLPIDSAKKYRTRLRETTVRVVQIHTVEEEMRYDVSYFVVEAGRPVQVVLKNEDLMGHNLVITTPGSMQEVADLGLAIGPKGDTKGRQYVPNSDKVLFATNLVATGKEERLTFTAPSELGEYPYVCTFPRHWMRMYGVMLVVDDVDAWLQNPVAPADPLGIKRSFVQSWTIDDFSSLRLEDASPERGKGLFTEATCSQCHKADGVGGTVGPELNGVLVRWKGDQIDVLREIIEPSHRIDPKYAVHLIVTEDGDTITGIVAAEDRKTISILANPESKDLNVVKKDSIEERVKTSTSMMPKGLMDRYSREEILDLLAYLAALQSESK